MNRSPPRALTPAFSTPDFRAALGMFATGVTIVTARDAAGSRSASPRTRSTRCRSRRRWCCGAWRASPARCRRSSAARTTRSTSSPPTSTRSRCASPAKAIDRFAGVPFRIGPSGAPVLDGAAAVFECFNRSQYEEGDHVIFVGEVEHCSHRPGAHAADLPRRALLHRVAAVARLRSSAPAGAGPARRDSRARRIGDQRRRTTPTARSRPGCTNMKRSHASRRISRWNGSFGCTHRNTTCPRARSRRKKSSMKPM